MAVVGTIVRGKRNVCRRAVLPVVQESANGSANGAAELVAGSALAKGFTMHTILLHAESVGDIIGS